MSSRRRKGKATKANLKTRKISNAKPTTPTSGPSSASPSSTNVPARYVAEIRNIMGLMMRNKGSQPFRLVPNLPEYKSMFPTALCLTTMHQKALREPCGYKSFKEFDADFKMIQRQEIRYDNKVHSGISAQRKHKIEILRGYYDTLAQPYLAHGTNLSPSNPRKKTLTPASPLPQAKKLIVPSSTESTQSSAPRSPRATITMKKKEQLSRPPPSTKKSIRKQPVIDLCEDAVSSPPSSTIAAPPSTVQTSASSTMRRKKSQTTGRKRLHFDSPGAGGDETKTAEDSNGRSSSGPAKKKIRVSRRASTSDDDVVVVSSSSTTIKTKKSTSPRSSSVDPLSTPVSRTGFSFSTSSSTSVTSKKRKDDTPRYGDKGGHSRLFGTDGRPPKMEDVKMNDDDSKDDGTEFMKRMDVDTPRGPRGRSGGVVLGQKTFSTTSSSADGRDLTPPRFSSSTSVTTSSYSSLQRRPTTWMGRLLRDSEGDVNMFTNTPTRTHEDVLHLLQWKRFELTVEIWEEEKQEWRSKLVIRDGFEMQAVVRKFFDVHPNLKMRVTNVRFCHNVSYDDEEDAN